jgi:hypothetical protein
VAKSPCPGDIQIVRDAIQSLRFLTPASLQQADEHEGAGRKKRRRFSRFRGPEFISEACHG